MLTGFQVSTGGYVTENGDLLCERCFEDGEDYARPISNYELDEWQTSYSDEAEWDYDDIDDEAVPEGLHVDDVDPYKFHAECELALCDDEGHELREAYHSHPERTVEELKQDA